MTKPTVSVPSVARLLRDIATPEGFERETLTEPKTNWAPAYKVLVLRSPDVEIRIDFLTSTHRRDDYYLASGHVEFDTVQGRRSFDRTGVEDSFYIDNPAKWVGSAGRVLFWSHTRVVHPRLGLGTVVDSAGYKGEPPNRQWVDEYVIAWDGDGETVTYTDKQLKRAKVKAADVIEQTNATIRRFIEERIPEARARAARSEQVPGIPFTITPEVKERVVRTLRGGKPYSFTPGGFGTGYTLSRPPVRKGRWGPKRAHKDTEEFFGVGVLYVETFDAD